MALFEMKFQPGVNKQDTGVGATDRCVVDQKGTKGFQR